MHGTFIFPMDCVGLLNKWDEDKGITFVEVDNELMKGTLIKGKPNILDEKSSYNPFDFESLIPEFIKMIDKILDGGDLDKHIKKWMCDWGPLYSNDLTKNTVEVFWEESIRFYSLWNLYKWVANHDKNRLMENIALEEYEDHYLINFFPGDIAFPEENIPMAKKPTEELFEEIQEKALVFLFKQVENYTSRAKLTWGSMKKEKEKGVSNIKIEHVLQIDNLIDAIYLQFYILFSENEKKICPVCNTPFIPERKDKKYCSDTCKLTARSRRYRARKAS